MPTHLLAVIPNRMTHQVLARPGVERGWVLPEARLDGRHWHAEHVVLAEALTRTLDLPAGIEVRLLRRLAEREHSSEDPATFLRELIFVAELAPHPAGAAPFQSGSDIATVDQVPGWEWIDTEAAASAAADWVAPALRKSTGRMPASGRLSST